MTEEQVTKHIINILKSSGWEILTFDYPQSGTGVRVTTLEDKFPSMIFDIIAKKDSNLLFFENKNRYYPQDFKKLHTFSTNIYNYEKSFNKIFGINLLNFNIHTCIGFPKSDEFKVKNEIRKLVDRIIFI